VTVFPLSDEGSEKTNGRFDVELEGTTRSDRIGKEKLKYPAVMPDIGSLFAYGGEQRLSLLETTTRIMWKTCQEINRILVLFPDFHPLNRGNKLLDFSYCTRYTMCNIVYCTPYNMV
jgi:hypothetical protein